MEITEKQLLRVKNDLERLAKEPLEVEHLEGVIYAFGSELGTLRIWRNYNSHSRNDKTQQNFSKNLDKWYFSLELGFSA